MNDQNKTPVACPTTLEEACAVAAEILKTDYTRAKLTPWLADVMRVARYSNDARESEEELAVTVSRLLSRMGPAIRGDVCSGAHKEAVIAAVAEEMGDSVSDMCLNFLVDDAMRIIGCAVYAATDLRPLTLAYLHRERPELFSLPVS